MPMHLVLSFLAHRWLIYMTKICRISSKYLYEYKIIKIIFDRRECFYEL